jgi:hypothetical protein
MQKPAFYSHSVINVFRDTLQLSNTLPNNTN